ncbi:hypothetical protein OJAV_G00083440 [Oryzias javanicus]|uniref:Uncharacterized protein n=1 Tax=Oryzias javanicus TaxID=123683 RepID=A0A437D533_ORYJA|nr:hypothetical protein OJAV_G00083440 [Oryzias javanicus]
MFQSHRFRQKNQAKEHYFSGRLSTGSAQFPFASCHCGVYGARAEQVGWTGRRAHMSERQQRESGHMLALAVAWPSLLQRTTWRQTHLTSNQTAAAENQSPACFQPHWPERLQV